MESHITIEEGVVNIEEGAVTEPSLSSADSASSLASHSAPTCPSTDLSQEQVDEFRAAFEMFDLDKDGRITEDELKTVMQKLRYNTSDIDIQSMIRRVDKDGNGTIEFDEFLEMMAARVRRQAAISEEERRNHTESEARQAFSVFDIDGDGLIDCHELKQTMSILMDNVTDEDVAAMMKIADTNGDGKVDFAEFASVFNQKPDVEIASSSNKSWIETK